MKFKRRRHAFDQVLTIVDSNLHKFAKGGHGKIEIFVNRRNAKELSVTVTAAPILKFDAPATDDPVSEDAPVFVERIEVKQVEDN